MRPEFDERDAEILKRNQQAWDAREGPRVGDFVRMLDGTLRRFTHDWGDGLQTTVREDCGYYGASFYFGLGYMSFSGSLDPSIPKERIEPTGEILEGGAWFFHHDYATAHNGVYFKVPCRVFKVKE